MAKCNLGKVKIEASVGQWCPHGQGIWGSHSILQGPLGFYSSHVCASSFRICLLAGACAVQVCCSQGCHGFAPRLAHFTCGTT